MKDKTKKELIDIINKLVENKTIEVHYHYHITEVVEEDYGNFIYTQPLDSGTRFKF